MSELIFWAIISLVALVVIIGGHEWLKARRQREIYLATQRRK